MENNCECHKHGCETPHVHQVIPCHDEHHYHPHGEHGHCHCGDGRIHPNPADKHITLLLSEIKYDVKFDTWLREKITNREMHNANKEAEKVEYAYSDDRAEDWLIRQIETAVDNVRGELNWCVVDWDVNISDEILNNPTEWCIHFHFSRQWRGSLRALRTAIHKYVCEYILSQWYRASMPNGSERYVLEADQWLTKAYNEARSEVVQYHPWTL